MDRNTSVTSSAGTIGKSLSARRAWIEMASLRPDVYICSVALRKESVDRNFGEPMLNFCSPKSLSARRAWIEMPNLSNMEIIKLSLSARRAWIEICID